MQNVLVGSSNDRLLTWDSSTGAVRNVSAGSFAWLTTGNKGINETTNFLGTTDANDLLVKTNSTERMRFTSGGQLLVNTSTSLTGGATAKLQINNGTTAGAIQIADGTQGLGKVLTSDANGLATWAVDTNWKTIGNKGTDPANNFLGTTDAQDLAIRTNNTEKIRVTSNGNVGIGTTSPTAPLAFSNTVGRKISLWSTGGPSGNDHQYYGLGILSGSPNALVNQIDATTANFIWRAATSSTTSNELMRLTGTGNIGIGTTVPAEKLDVNGTVNANNYISPVQTVVGGTWDLSKGANAKWSLAAGANTLSLTNMKAGMYGTIIVTNTGTSTITFGGGVNKVINGGGGVVSLTPIANAVDVLSFMYDGSTFWWTVGNNYN
ncbi:hypothetical protein [Flavobacterium daemonense]|uniref:hypothetical protein n=1 Tax=Flavobacterium daemonense TaxID=1393049 RepID=UPI00118658DB|nr:hypothetical protein [Flavobacterium daemonense]KAF2329012.1 hypothetical protein FND99_16920 [Flavobacterium daemonense]